MPTSFTPDDPPLAGALIVFDLDGTLVETAPDLIGALNVVLGEHGHPPLLLSAARHLVGRGARALLTRGFEEAGEPLTDETAPPLVARFLEVYEAHIADGSHAFDGVAEALDVLTAAGARLAVCTNKPGGLSRLLLGKLGLLDRFAVVTGADDAPVRKPDPRHLLACVEQAGGAERVLMVGDSIADVSAARGAGVPVIVVSFGYTETPAAELGGDVLLDHFAQVPAAALRLLAPDAAH